MLGTVTKDPEAYAKYIASKAPDQEDAEEEIGTVPEEEGTVEEEEKKKEKEKQIGYTGFHKDDKTGQLFIYNYMIKGFFKAALEVLQQNGAIKKIPAFRKWTDLLIFVEPRRILLGLTEPDTTLERPLRINFPLPRVTITKSDVINKGRRMTFQVSLLKNSAGITWEVLEGALTFGEFVGLGQWRGSGAYGRFKVIKSIKKKLK